MLGAIAQFETEIRAERQMDGIRKAREQGVHFGRKKRLAAPQIAELKRKREQGVLIKTLMKDYDLSKASVYRYLEKTESLRGFCRYLILLLHLFEGLGKNTQQRNSPTVPFPLFATEPAYLSG